MATPLLWLTVWKEELTEQRNDFEDACLRWLQELVPPGCAVTILADRGFGDHKLFAFLDDLGFDYVIRFRGNIHVTDATGETRPAAEWVGKSGRARKLRDARVTASHGYKIGAVVCVHAKAMKEPWCLAASNAEASSAMLVNYYAKRWTIEPNFRDIKDLRFGMGLGVTRIGEPTRRDRLLLINAFAMVLLTMLGAAGESLGMDRLLKSNTSKTRTHSLFRQGCMLYELIPARLSVDSRVYPNRLAVDSVPRDNGMGAVTWVNRWRSLAWSIRRRSFEPSRRRSRMRRSRGVFWRLPWCWKATPASWRQR